MRKKKLQKYTQDITAEWTLGYRTFHLCCAVLGERERASARRQFGPGKTSDARTVRHASAYRHPGSRRRVHSVGVQPALFSRQTAFEKIKKKNYLTCYKTVREREIGCLRSKKPCRTCWFVHAVWQLTWRKAEEENKKIRKINKD
jgi:hypothetical protein